jgi:16S rRNA G966 N2-methylase RsmD
MRSCDTCSFPCLIGNEFVDSLPLSSLFYIFVPSFYRSPSLSLFSGTGAAVRESLSSLAHLTSLSDIHAESWQRASRRTAEAPLNFKVSKSSSLANAVRLLGCHSV